MGDKEGLGAPEAHEAPWGPECPILGTYSLLGGAIALLSLLHLLTNTLVLNLNLGLLLDLSGSLGARSVGWATSREGTVGLSKLSIVELQLVPAGGVVTAGPY
jgi:hypothetical protein